MDTQDTYNRIAADWVKEQVDTDWWIKGLDYFALLFPAGATILDVGCGHGDKANYLVEKGLRVLGIDFSEKLIQLGQQQFPNVEFAVMDMKDIDHLDRTFDGVLAQASLLHLPRKEVPAIVKSLTRKLKSNGYLYIAVKEVKPGSGLEEIKKEDNYGYPYERFFSYFVMEELKDYMNKAGLTITYENRTNSGRSNWLQIIGQKNAEHQ